MIDNNIETLDSATVIFNNLSDAQYKVDWKVAKHAVPFLLRGYLELGACISGCAVNEPVFNLVFVCI